jgi:dephospho-CoA kinase
LHEAGETRSRGSDPFFQQAPGELAYLEQLTHPHIGRCLRERIVELSRAGVRATVLDAAVMLKAGWDDACDRILFVDAPRDLRVARARQRGWSEAEFAAREAAQESLDDKRSRADVVVDNSSTLENTCAQVERFWRSLFPFR